MSEYRKAKKRIEVSVRESVRIMRELQEISQNELASATGIPPFSYFLVGMLSENQPHNE